MFPLSIFYTEGYKMTYYVYEPLLDSLEFIFTTMHATTMHAIYMYKHSPWHGHSNNRAYLEKSWDNYHRNEQSYYYLTLLYCVVILWEILIINQTWQVILFNGWVLGVIWCKWPTKCAWYASLICKTFIMDVIKFLNKSWM